MLDIVGAGVLVRSGLLRPVRPDRLLGMGRALLRYGVTPATGYAAAAARSPDRPAVVDDEGVLTFRQVDRRSDRIAGELRQRGVRDGDAVGLLARNGRGFVESVVALAKCGADVLYLNTGSSGGQLAQVLDREKAVAIVHDEEFGELVADACRERLCLTTEELGSLAEQPGPGAPGRPSNASRQVIMTSGTTGAPRGAARSKAGPEDAVAALSRIPLRAQETTVIAAPVFHAWGLGHLSLAIVLGSTVVLHRRFDPDRVLRSVEEQRATALVVVPVMLVQLLEALERGSYDTSSLRVIASSGSALPGGLATKVLDAFGPVLYNLYGSTEVAYAAVATPQDLLADPGCAGKPPHGVTLRVVDDGGRDVPPGTPGRIFVGSGLAFSGYTDGSDKDRLGNLVATGDVGRLDDEGRLTVLGRDDDMVVIGGENVYPSQVEEVLHAHPSVSDVAVVDVPDEQWGARLVAHVVPAAGAQVDEKELQERVRTELARFAVPREVRVVDELPRNATGKVLKRELREA
ncbi:MAG TPA: AMP-binding protein [Mycobacteriales bacterium]|nr:AMP-binding protein [Mycobacteriales bacterium]